ncbi:MAG: 30S ribosomal protein S3 [Candidatus Nomurabacteria bacterium]|jgi:small subunit ribosomal protein S3|nr:30S ribosomal protein S3 [Candidatus Nomurabacteria bacterium]
MGQKVNPISMRLQVHKNWASKWFASGKKDFAKWLAIDLAVRRAIEKKFETRAVINHIDIERNANQTTVTIWTSKAGVVIGRQGSGVQELRAELEKIIGSPVRLDIEEVRKPDLAAKIVAENIARQLERRINFRRAMKMAIQNVMNAGAKGVRIEIAGRLNGAEMSRREKLIEGSVPLHTLRADISYHMAVAKTQAGTIGIKVWIHKGEMR